MVIVALFTITRIWRQPECPPMDELIKKMEYIIRNAILFSHKGNEILPLPTTWMYLEGITLGEIS